MRYDRHAQRRGGQGHVGGQRCERRQRRHDRDRDHHLQSRACWALTRWVQGRPSARRISSTLCCPTSTLPARACRRLGSLLEQYGTYEMNGIAFQDVDEIWWLETIGGHHWMARRVPDDVYVVMPNQLGMRHAGPGRCFGRAEGLHVLGRSAGVYRKVSPRPVPGRCAEPAGCLWQPR